MSNNYVKKYDVGQIKLDLPYANYIHELPLLSFGDVQHTVNLSLVFNSDKKEAQDNTFNIADGFKLNMQKRIIKEDGEPVKFEESNGKLIDVTYTCGVYTFDDKTQRILRTTPFGYEIEYPDFSKETFNNDGNIIGAYTKYDKETPFLTYEYENGKLISITYRGTKTISFGYSTSNKLVSIVYAEKMIEIVNNNDNHLTIKHFSGVDFHFDTFNNNLVVYSASRDGEYSNISNRITCTEEDSSMTFLKELGYETLDTVIYEFLCFENNKITVLDVTNKKGVKKRVHFKDEELLYFYEIGLDNDGFLYDRYCGTVQINNVLNNSSDVSTNGIQNYWDGFSINTNSVLDLSSLSAYEKIYILSGWIKTMQENNSDTFEIRVAENNNANNGITLHLSKMPEGEWTYFSTAFSWDPTTMYICIDNVETKDLRLTCQPISLSAPTNTDNIARTGDVLILEDTNGNSLKILSPITDCQFFNGSTIIGGTVTMRDVLQYKINQMYGTHKNIIFYDDYKKAVASAGDLCIKYTDEGIIHTVSVNSLAVGKRTYTNGKEYVTKTNFYLDENNNYHLVTKNSINGEIYKEEVHNDNLDIVLSTVEDASVHYEYESCNCGLVSKKTIAPKNVSPSEVTRADVMTKQYVYNDALTKIESTIDDFGNVTSYTTDDTWGVVTEVTLPNGTVIKDEYDDDKCALLSRMFSADTNARKTNFSYTNGNLSGLIHSDNDDSIDYTFTYDKNKLEYVKKGANTIEQHAHTDTTHDCYYPQNTGALYSVHSDYDKYGRLINTNNLVENVYDIKPEYDENGNLSVKSANESAVLATSEDLTNHQKSKFHYNDQSQLVKKCTNNSSGTVISEEEFAYDDIGRLISDTCTYDKSRSKSVKTEILYEKAVDNPLADNVVNRYSYYLNGATSPIAQTGYDFDSFNRVSSKFYTINGAEFTKNITYDKSKPRRLLETLNGRPLCTIDYTYDNMGRMSSVSTNGDTTQYTYDNYGQLVEEKNVSLDKSIQYVYNGIGNIMSAKTVYSNGSTTTKSFTYGDTNNPDRLTSYNGKTIQYNTLGCPTSYDGKTLTWTNGKLTKILSGTIATGRDTYNYKYNALGQRVEKSFTHINTSRIQPPPGGGFDDVIVEYLTDSSTNYYYDHAGRLLAEYCVENYSNFTQSSTRLEYLYDGNKKIGFVYTAGGVNKGAYYFQRNLQGDIIAIYNTSGSKVVEYSYDAYGNCSITSATTDYTIADVNPIRYRGYYLDKETGWYFLNARYYSPEWRRFISPDDTYYLNPKNVNGCNLYCYCNNDPIVYVDPLGTVNTTYLDGEYDLDDEMYNYSGCGGGYYGPGSAYYTYTVRTNTATYDAQLGGYHSSGTTSAMTNPSYFIVPGAVTITDGMAINTFQGNPGTNNATKVHGNSLNSTKTNYGYALTDSLNNILKFGETINPSTRYSKTYLTQHDATMNILVTGSKIDIHLWQHDMNEYYYYKYGEYPPLNKRGW